MSTAIKFENISKQYRLGNVSTNTLSHDLNRWWQTSIRGKEDPYLKIGDVNDRATKGTSDYVWALKGIDFEVQQGDVLGIIGKNGAGKSTLLKILSKVTAPTTGSISARGRIASLLEVGTGFHPEMTGRENIYMNGAIMGMSKAEINGKFDEIVDFSGIERYIDTPAKRYSSGMTVRLGFAIAAHLDPEILVVDEVLAVGDAEFQNKAIGKMQDISKGQGRTVLFVSHNLTSIQLLCPKSVLMKNGSIELIDETNKVIDYYTLNKEMNKDYDRKGSKKIVFTDYGLINYKVDLSEDLDIWFKVRCNELVGKVDFSFDILNENHEPIAHLSNQDDEFYISNLLLSGKEFEISSIIRNINLAPGNYFISLWAGDSYEWFDYIENCIKFTVNQGNKMILRPSAYDIHSKVVLSSNWKMLL